MKWVYFLDTFSIFLSLYSSITSFPLVTRGNPGEITKEKNQALPDLLSLFFYMSNEYVVTPFNILTYYMKWVNTSWTHIIFLSINSSITSFPLVTRGNPGEITK